jgi:hypothetical protein
MSRLGSNGRLEAIAKLYGCKIAILRVWEDGNQDVVFATFGTPGYTLKQERICGALYASSVDLNAVHTICQELSGKSLMAFWTGASEVKHG